MDCGWEGREPSKGPVQALLECRLKCLLLGPWTGRCAGALWLWQGWSPVTWSFQNLQSDRIGRFTSRGSWTVAKRGWGSSQATPGVHSQDQGLYTHYPIHEWAWPLLGPLVYGAGDTTKAKQDCSWVFRGMELFPCLYLGPRSASQLPGSLLRVALLGLGLHWGFTTSYLNPKAPTNALLSVDRCW